MDLDLPAGVTSGHRHLAWAGESLVPKRVPWLWMLSLRNVAASPLRLHGDWEWAEGGRDVEPKGYCLTFTLLQAAILNFKF